jgi:hypothetical protein
MREPNPPNPAQTEIIEECYSRSVRLLKNNSISSGVIACAKSAKAVGRHYASIFGRDTAICSLGMVASGKKELIKIARKGLFTLARYQAPNGQIPKYVIPELDEVDFWYYGCIDATLWWLIALDFYDRTVRGEQIKLKLDTEIRLAVYWLLCQEHQGLFLLQQNEASDWADIMPRSGFVLYTNALWYHVKRIYGIHNAKKTKYFLKHIFYPFHSGVPEHRRARILTHYVKKKEKRSEFYLSFVNFSFWGPELDVFGNILSGLFEIDSLSETARMADALLKLRVNHPYPVRAVDVPLRRNSCLWRPYMERHRQNLPYQYHNGGVWPFVGGFWVMMLARLAREKLAWEELGRYAEANKVNDWEFNEWFHGKTGEPMGMGGQSWNAAMFILAFHALRDKVRLSQSVPPMGGAGKSSRSVSL